MEQTNLTQKVNNLPKVPGVYLYKNLENEIIYVGKAKNLRSRVKSYFLNNLSKDSKTYALVENIVDMDYIEVLSEFEALILEAELIKKYRPKYNISLKDDKSYIYIVINYEKINGVEIPRVITARKPDLSARDIYFGPFPDASTTKFIVKTIRRIFPFRDCSSNKYLRYQKLGKPCLYGHIGLCQAPCVGNISLGDYKKEVTKVKSLLEGKKISVINEIEKKMQDSSKSHAYEKAAEFRDLLNKFNYVIKNFKAPQNYIDNPYLVDDIVMQSLTELVKNIPILTTLPNRIECYDISNLSGKEAVGSMVVAIDGRIANKEYRRFKIKLKSDPDDFGMIREVIKRRLKRIEWEYPDLFVIDGGKGQVSAAKEVLKELNVNIPVVGLAKRFELIVYEKDGHFFEIELERNNEGLKLLQRLRDEAHRFAQRYHHLLRAKRLALSP